MEFRQLPIHPAILQNIDRLGFTRCTPIQAQTLPLTLKGKDVAGQAQTGTGKTAAFLIAIFTQMMEHPPSPHPGPGAAPTVFIVAPTRELAVQLEQDARALGAGTGFRIHTVYGGMDYLKQARAFQEGVDMLIGTPGRLIDYLKQKLYTLKRVHYLVIDEADRMFDMGFIPDLRYMLRRMPPYHRRQSMLFSATLSLRVRELAYEHMNNPAAIDINPEQVTAEKVDQVLFHVERRKKFSLLLGILEREGWSRVLLFVNTKRQAERLEERLTRHGHEAGAITGDIPQQKRLRMMENFKAGKLPILVATDVASRGLHIEAVSHVINYDLPQDSEDYVHRIGRTARAGAEGRAISLACEEFVYGLEDIERYIGHKIPVEWPEDDLFVKPIPRPRAKVGAGHPVPLQKAQGRGKRRHTSRRS